MAKRSDPTVLIDNKPYKIETETKKLQGTPVTIHNITPVLNPTEHTLRTADISNELYDIFVKYRSKRR